VAVVTEDLRNDHARRCIHLLKRHTRDFDLWILDNNGSPDFSHSREMNKVLKSARTDYLVLMDDDVFVEEGWLPGLLRAMDDETGLVVPIHRDAVGGVSFSGVYLMGDEFGTHAHLVDVPDHPRVTQCVCGALMLIDRRKCGDILFGEEYRKYFIDIDHSLRIWEAGYQVVCTPHVTVTHLGGATISREPQKLKRHWRTDQPVFVHNWIDNGRLAQLERGIWERHPFIKEQREIPRRIRHVTGVSDGISAPDLDRELQACFELSGPYPLFRSLLLAGVRRQLHSFAKRHEPSAAQICRYWLARLDGTVEVSCGPAPQLLETYREFNLVECGDDVLGVPLALGECNLDDPASRKLPGVLIANSAAAVRALVDAERRAQFLAMPPTPRLLGARRDYNLVEFGDEVLAVPRALGPVDLQDANARKLPGMLFADSLEAACALVDARPVSAIDERGRRLGFADFFLRRGAGLIRRRKRLCILSAVCVATAVHLLARIVSFDRPAPLPRLLIAAARESVDDTASVTAPGAAVELEHETAYEEDSEDARHWSFSRVIRPPVPCVLSIDWPRHAIDCFILEKLEQADLLPAEEADRQTLIRRLSFDLVGLPPSPDEVAEFVDDSDPAAYEKLVDRLLASVHFGERWGSHWLDVVRYAESSGFETNQPRPNAWPYRDYVIRAFNEDLPYNRFVIEQLAGDALGVPAATGFLVAGARDGVKSSEPVLTATQRADELHDLVNTTGTAFLGLSIGCARCHDHKFDPIPQADYYAVKAVFAGVHHGDRDWRQDRELREPRPAGMDLPPVIYAGIFGAAEVVYRLDHGDAMRPQDPIAPGVLSHVGGRVTLPADALDVDRRLALGRWIAHSRHPLTARVIVNRLWQHHFGDGLVASPSDFGMNGAAPSHPELLDWLAAELVARRWSLKAIHRLIVLSSTYRQSSVPNPTSMRCDAGTRLLWRYPPRRLEAEPLRDAVLAVSGQLNLKMGGPGFDLFEPNDNYVKVYNPKTRFGPDEWRRMVYQSKPRMQLDDTFGAFDCPDAGQIAPRRTNSTTPLQALNLLNSPFMIEQSRFFAERLLRESGSDIHEQVRRAFWLAFQREPTADEMMASETLILDGGLLTFCRALFNANEFVIIN
jgi:hypothetical protein